MGNSSTKGPITDKVTKDGKNSFLRFGLCEMQGWRSKMVIIQFLIQGRCFNFNNRRRKKLLLVWNFRWSRRYSILNIFTLIN